MSLETGKKIIDFAFDITPLGKKINFSFFGGEPLLQFNLIKNLTKYIEEKGNAHDNPILLSITTNGLLLNESIINFFWEHEFNVCVSIDGPLYVNDLNRCYKDGSGSFDDVFKKLLLIKKSPISIQVNAVYDPKTLNYLPKTLSFFTENEFPIIHLNPDITALWEKQTLNELSSIYMQLAMHYISCFEAGKEIAVNLLDNKTILLLKGGYREEEKCRMGEAEWGFAPSGNIYPCERFIGQDDDKKMCIGNIHTGINNYSLCKIIENRGNINEECKMCEFQKYCMNWCGCTNYHMTGRTNITSSFICESEKSSIKAAIYVLNALKHNDLFINHFYNYLNENLNIK